MSTKKKIFIPMIVLTIVCGIAVLLSSILLFNRRLNNSMNDKINIARNITEFEIEDLLSKSLLTASAMRVHQNLSEALINNDNERIAIIANSLKNMAHLDFCTILDKDGIVIVRVHDPENYGDSLMGLSHIQSAFEDRVESFIVPGVTIRLGVMAGSPIYDLEGNIVGAISLGFRLDSQEFVQKLGQLTACEVSIFLHDDLITSTITNEDGSIASDIKADENISTRVLAGESYSGREKFLGRNLISEYIPLPGMNDEVVGMIVIGYDTAEAMRDTQIFIVAGVLVTLFVLAVCIIFARQISNNIEGSLNKANERTALMLDTSPLCTQIWDRELNIIDCNEAAVKLYGFTDKREFLDSFLKRCHPEYQPDGQRSDEKALEMVNKAFNEGRADFEWLHKMPYSDTTFPAEITIVRAKYDDDDVLVGYTRDLREFYKMMERVKAAHSTTSAMFESNPHINILFDSNFKLIDCNPASLRFLGSETKEELLGSFEQRMEKFLPEYQPDGRRTLPLAERLMITANEGTHKISTVINLGDKPRHLDMEFRRIPYDESFAIVAYVQDMTEIREHEAELLRINDVNELHLIKLNTVIKATKIALWDGELPTDGPVGPDTPVEWSEEFKAILGYGSDDDFPNVFGSWMQRLHPDDAESTLNMFAAHLYDTTGNTPFNTEYRLQKKNGEYSYYLAAGSAIRNADGVALRVAGALMDISETKDLQFSLEHERAMLQLMFDSSPDHIFCKDTDFLYTRCNETLLKYHGIKKEELIGKDDESGLGVPAEIALEYRVADCVVLNENKASVGEERVPASDGSVRLFETNKVPLIFNGKPIGIMGVARDITERKAMEEAAQSANRSKTVFLANMSHEIRTPMNSIIGFSELAQNDEIPDKTRTYLSNIQDSAEWLLKIINDILDISKIESGKIEFEHIPFDLPDIFSYCQSSIMPKIAEKGIMLYCYAEPSIGKRLIGDPVRLRQIIMNLLSNAVKFTNSGTVKFLASIIDSDEDSVNIRFEIKDSGIGMSNEQVEKVFNPFTQADDSITRRFGGTGLGLTITKNIIEHMGGTLSVESAPGVGSMFSFTLKFGLIDEDDLPHEAITINDYEKPNFKGEVLVCEDNILNQHVVCDHLDRVGLSSVVAHNGQECVDIVTSRIKNNEKPFDLIFMDIHMPVMDGLDAAQKIKAMGIKTPIVALTANIMSNDMELYRNSGMYDTVGKPFSSQDLWRCLAKYIPIESYTAIDKPREAAEDGRAQKLIKTNFVRSNQTIYEDIVSAIDSGDIRRAHRLAHTLKSNAGQIGKKELQTAAANVEASLKGESTLPDEQEMKILKIEISSVLGELAPLLDEASAARKIENVDVSKALELLDKLEPLLKKNNTMCLKFIDELHSIPETEELIAHIQRLKFTKALAELEKLRNSLT